MNKSIEATESSRTFAESMVVPQGQQAANKIHFSQFKVVEEDEVAQIAEIFKHFDFGNRGRVATSDLPNILRLLQHNIGEEEDKELRYEIDKKNRGYFTMRELTSMLANTGFKDQPQQALIEALMELDEDADGFIEKSEFIYFMKHCGEPLSEEEMFKLMDIACETDTDMPDLIDIKRLAEILLPKIKTENALTKGAGTVKFERTNTKV